MAMRLITLVAAAAAALALTSASMASEQAASTLTVHPSAYGQVLFDGRGFVLYAFTKDRRRSACSGACAKAWPPYVVRGALRAGAGVKASLLGTVRRTPALLLRRRHEAEADSLPERLRVRRSLARRAAERQARSRLGGNCFSLHLGRVHPGARGAVHLGAMVIGLLRGLDVLLLATPRLQCRCLERASVGEGQLPRMLPQRVHRVEVCGRVLVRLPARQKDDSRDGRGHMTLEAPDRLLRDLLVRRLLRALVPGEHHVRLQQHPFRLDALVPKLGEDRVQRP